MKTNSLSLRFIEEWIWQHLVCTGFFALIALGFYSLPFALGIGAGGLWAALNLFFIKSLVVNLLSQNSQTPVLQIAWILLFKFPLVYFLGYCLLKIDYFPYESLVIGFSSLFLVVFLKGIKLY